MLIASCATTPLRDISSRVSGPIEWAFIWVRAKIFAFSPKISRDDRKLILLEIPALHPRIRGLKSHRIPNPSGFRTNRFHAFISGEPSVSIPVAPGVYACAYRFVKTATGEATDLVQIDTMVVSLVLADSASTRSKAA